jgi:hypothetical protein
MIKKLLRILTTFLLFLSCFANANDNKDTIACLAGLFDYLDIELVEMIEKQSYFNAKKLAKELILNKCRREVSNGNKDIVVGKTKIIFTQYSDTFDTNDDLFFCKNKSGYESYLSTFAQKLTLFSRERERIKREKELKLNPPKPRRVSLNRSQPRASKVETWDCVNPFYYMRKVKKLTKSEMEAFIIAHPNSCAKSAD